MTGAPPPLYLLHLVLLLLHLFLPSLSSTSSTCFSSFSSTSSCSRCPRAGLARLARVVGEGVGGHARVSIEPLPGLRGTRSSRLGDCLHPMHSWRFPRGLAITRFINLVGLQHFLAGSTERRCR